MEITTESRDGVTIVALPRIPLDNAFVNEFSRDIGALIVASPKLVLDMRRLLFIDSAGVGALVANLKRAREKGGDIRLCGVPSQVRAVLEVAHLDKLFEIFPAADEAVAAFARPA